MNYKIKFYCKKLKLDHDGNAPIYISLSAPKTPQILIATNQSVDPDCFDNKFGMFCKKVKNQDRIWNKLEAQKEDLEKVIEFFREDGIMPSLGMIKKKYQSQNLTENFYDFAKSEAEAERGILTDKTIDTYIYCLTKMNDYSPNLSFSELTIDFLEEYRSYLRHVRGRQDKGIYQDFATIRKFWNKALKVKKVRNDIFSDFKLDQKSKTSIENYLVKDQLLILLDLYKSSKLEDRLQCVLYYYLIACFTSLRSKDILELSRKLIKERGFTEQLLAKKELRIALSKSKYSKVSVIPISGPLKFLLEHPVNKTLVQKIERRNNALREILAVASIDKYLTFHSSRHTFGVVAIQLGIDLATIKDIYQHSDFKLTMMYAKIAQEHRVKEMSKWDNF